MPLKVRYLRHQSSGIYVHRKCLPVAVSVEGLHMADALRDIFVENACSIAESRYSWPVCVLFVCCCSVIV